MKLYYGQGACSLGIHILLNEAGAAFESAAVDLKSGEQYQPAYQAINPKSKVPALALDGGGVLTEWPAIASYIAAAYPDHHLISQEPLTAARTLEAVMYVNSTMHLAGFARMFRPANFSPNPEEKEAVRAKGQEIFFSGFSLLARTLGDKEYLMGDFSIADAALFYVTFWNQAVAKLDLPATIQAHYARMVSRPAVQKTMHAEGLA
jgi:glutathione S-transferase